MPHQIVIGLLRGTELLLPEIHARLSAKDSRCVCMRQIVEMEW